MGMGANGKGHIIDIFIKVFDGRAVGRCYIPAVSDSGRILARL
jgi:hypothetical protein